MAFKARKNIFRIVSLALVVALLIPVAHATAGEQKLCTTRALMDNLLYMDTITQNTGGRVESYAMEYTPGGSITPIMLQGSGTICTAASISKAVSNAQAKGYHVLGAVNTDFFSGSTGIPMGIVVEDGVYKSSPEEECAVIVTDGAIDLVETPQVQMTLTNQTNTAAAQPSITVSHLNKQRVATGGLYLLNEYFSDTTRTNSSGWMVRMKELEGKELSVSGLLHLQVTGVTQTAGALDIGPGEYILTADANAGYDAVFSSFRFGDYITISTQCNSPQLIAAQWASGAGDVMLQNGQLTDSSKWTYMKDGRAPRTALGVRWDGSVVIYVVDGRQSGYSAGLTQMDLAWEMASQNCRWAVNLDGGGSSAMTVWLPGQSEPTLVNRPSDGNARACATYMLLVSQDTGDGTPARLALKSDGLVVLTGSSVNLGSATVLDSGLNPLEVDTGGVTVQSGGGLGTLEGTIYMAGEQAGTDTLHLTAQTLPVEGTATVHVVDTLTDLYVYRDGVSVESLSLQPGDTVQLTAQGSYWSRIAMRDGKTVTWAVQGDVGTIDAQGLFTVPWDGGTSGSIAVSAGGITTTIPVSVADLHTDVGPDHWAYDAVVYCYQNGLVNGVTADRFGPDQSIRRGDFVLMLYRAVGSPTPNSPAPFTDVSAEDYYANAIAWGYENGLVAGTGDNAFSPQSDITREQAFTIIHRALPLLSIQVPAADGSVLSQFADQDRVSAWAVEHIAALVAGGIVDNSSPLRPKESLIRAEMAVLLYTIGQRATEMTDPDVSQPNDTETAETTETIETAETPDALPPDGEPEPETEIETDPEPEPGDTVTTPEDTVDTPVLTLRETEVTLNPGDSFPLTAVLLDGAVGPIVWTSHSLAAFVDTQGVVTNLNTTGADADVLIEASWGGYIASAIVHCPAGKVGVVHPEVNVLNVRSGPSMEAPILDHVAGGMGLLIVDEGDGTWLRVQYLAQSGSPATGYVSGDYITIS